MSDKAVGELGFSVKYAKHFGFLNNEHGGGCNRGRCGHANGLASQAAFSQKITRSQYFHYSFFTGFVDDGELHTAFLNIKDIFRRIALREDGVFVSKLFYLSSEACRIEKSLHVERRVSGNRVLGGTSGGNGYTRNYSGQHAAE